MSMYTARCVVLSLLAFDAGCRNEVAPQKEETSVEPVAEAGQRVAKEQSEPNAKTAKMDPPPGPRTPNSRAFGFSIGKSTPADVEARLQSLGVDCTDTGPRAMMQRAREKKKAELQEASKTSDADAVSGASVINKQSKKEKNPQVRLSCPNTRLAQFGVERTADAAGRTLLVFDDSDGPLRHVSSRRTQSEFAAGVADVEEAVAAWTSILGPPTSTQGDVAELAPPEPTGIFVKWDWEYSDYLVRVEIASLGKRFSVSERAEVPMRIRADAPTLAQAPQDSPSAQ
jgi:hypothetical protein